MNFVISPGARTGAVRIPASKSQAHRLLICAALGKAPVTVRCDGLNADILATAACLRALGANIAEQDGALHVEPIKAAPDGLCVLPCGESGSTLRFCSRSLARSARTRCSCGKDGCLSARSNRF